MAEEEIKHNFITDSANYIVMALNAIVAVYLFTEMWPKEDGTGYNKFIPIIALGLAILMTWKYLINKAEVVPVERDRFGPPSSKFGGPEPPSPFMPGPGGRPMPRDDYFNKGGGY